MSGPRLARNEPRDGVSPPLQGHELYAIRGRERVPLCTSGEAHDTLTAAGASGSHAVYRLRRACDQGVVRYMELDAVRKLYAAEDVLALAEALRTETSTADESPG